MARAKRSTRQRRESKIADAPEHAGLVVDPTVWVGGLAVALVVGALYVRTAARDIVFGDSSELTGAAATLGVAHPPGYPLWTVLGHLFTLVPFGTIPFRVSLFSVAAGVACTVVVYLTAHRLTKSALASAVAAVVVALVPVVWTWSVVPEVFALADALGAALLYFVLRWHQDGRERGLIAAAFVGGLGLAHQQTIVLLAPAVLYLMWRHRTRLRGGALVLRAAVAVLAGVVPYIYLLIAAARHPPWNWGEISSLSDFVGHVLRVGYGTGSLVSVPRFQGGSVLDRLLSFGRSFTLAEALLMVIGLIWLYRRDRGWFWATAIAAALAGPLFIAYTNITLEFAVLQAVLERFFLLPHVVLAPIVACGIAGIADALRKRTVLVRRGAELALAGAALAMTLVGAAGQWQVIDASESHLARTFGEDILSATRANIILLAAGDAVVGPIGYLRTVEGARPDITFVQMPLLWGDWYVRQLRREYPSLALPFDRLDGARGTLRALVDANGAARFDIMGSLIDDSLGSSFGLYRRGIVEELRTKQISVDIDALAAENDAALRSYRIPTASSLVRPWDRLILADYAYIALDVGGIYERSKRTSDARRWYERAVAIDPGLDEARKALAALPP